MKTVWTSGLDKKDVGIMAGDFKSAILLRKRLGLILDNKIESKRTEMRDVDNYNKASLSEYYADCIGYERALKEVISLVLEKN